MKKHTRMKQDLSILVPAYNEADNLPSAVAALTRAMNGYGHPYEILVIDDGSTDKTIETVRALSRTYRTVRSVRHTTNRGFADAIRTGIREARFGWIATFHGDNDASAESLRRMAEKAGNADIVSGYLVGGEKRPMTRRIVSWLFVRILNLLFGLRLHYYTGFFVARRDVLSRVKTVSHGLVVYAEIRIRLLGLGASILEMPLLHTGRKHGTSSALNWRSFADILRVVAALAVMSRNRPGRQLVR